MDGDGNAHKEERNVFIGTNYLKGMLCFLGKKENSKGKTQKLLRQMKQPLKRGLKKKELLYLQKDLLQSLKNHFLHGKKKEKLLSRLLLKKN